MSTIFQQLDKLLLVPHKRLTNPEKIQRSRLLSTILLGQILIVVLIIFLVLHADPTDINEPTVQGAILLSMVSVLFYFINRFGYTSIPAFGLSFLIIAMFIYIPFYSGENPAFLAFLIIPLLFTAIFFSVKQTTIVSLGVIALVGILLSFMDKSPDNLPYWNLRNMWYFLMLTTGLILTFMRHIGNLEQVRQHELRKINDELEQKVAELERFTYTVSHELKNPVVTIKGFLGSVERDIDLENYDKARKDFLRISNATDKLHSTLTDLLELSRVGRVVNSFEEFPLADLVREALDLVERRIRSRNVTITVAPNLPTVHGNRVQLREVFENLIDNAAKYTGNQKSPAIEIGMQDGQKPVFFVKDNGMGVEPQYHTRIFGLFEKLDPTSEGTGVGLALIKRIIETHGGQIWVESDGLGEGSTFCFTLPKN